MTKKRINRSSGGVDKASSSSSSNYEEVFYDPLKDDINSDKDKLSYQRITSDQYEFQNDVYTREMLDQLSRSIRRHPSITSNSYRFQESSMSIKWNHQLIRLVVSIITVLALISLITLSHLPIGVDRINIDPILLSSSSNINIDKSIIDNSIGKNTINNNIGEFKQGWTKLSVIGISNYLCGNYHFNPLLDIIMSFAKTTVINQDSQQQQQEEEDFDIKSIKIFGACIVSGVTLFILWIIAMKLADREIVLSSSIKSQMGHIFLTLFAIPLATMMLCSLFTLYFTQTIMIGVDSNQLDTRQCVNRLAVGLGELLTFSPIRELMIGALSIGIRVLNIFSSGNLPLAAIALHDQSGLSDYMMNTISLMWSIVIGCTIYHLFHFISCIYTIFRDNKDLHSKRFQQQQQSSTTSTTSTTKTTARVSHGSDVKYLSLDLKFLPSFVPYIVTTLNFIITLVTIVISLLLWIFGSPLTNVHEGEIYYCFMAMIPIIKSVYNMFLIDQRKNHIPKQVEFYHRDIDSDSDLEGEDDK